MNATFKIQRTVSTEWDGKLLRDYILKELKLSQSALKTIKFNEGLLEANGESRTVRYQVREGDVITVTFPPEASSPTLIAEEMPLMILHEDEHSLILNKPANLPVIPSMKYSTGTLANGILAHLQKQNLPYTVHTVTRLDRDTSGVMLIAKHRHAHDLFVRMQKEHAIHRRYIAVVEGQLMNPSGTIDAPIGRKENSIIERTVTPDGKPARTHYTVIERHKAYTIVVIRLETGRTHQIRVHFQSIGHPLAGDDLYGGSFDVISRQALHSFEICYRDPFTGTERRCYAPLPDDITKLFGTDPILQNL